MVPILTVIFVIALSMFVTKAATIALMHTGMSRERARFQARSAFSGAGFTTTESELVVKHPIRRRIIMWLILMGNAGVVTAIASLIIGFTGDTSGGAEMRKVILLVSGIFLLVLATRWSWLDRWLDRLINFLLVRFTDIRPKSFARILTVMDDYEINEIHVSDIAWLVGRRLEDLNLTAEGLLVLGILRNEQTYIGVPRGRYEIEENDRLFIYGKAERLKNLAERRDPLEGKQEHKESVESFREELDEQDEAVDAGDRASTEQDEENGR